MTLNEIDTKSKEGRLLFAALAILTVSPQLRILGNDVQGNNTTPDEMISLLEESADKTEEATNK